MMDAILQVSLQYGQHSQENNFSELLIEPIFPVPPVVNNPPPVERPQVSPEIFPVAQPIAWQPLLWAPLPLIVGGGHLPEMSWHLSVVNGGYPRGIRTGEEISPETIAENTEHLDVRAWTVRGMKTSSYRYISAHAGQIGQQSVRILYPAPSR